MVAIPKITKRFETSLASALSAAGTSFTLESATDEDGNALSGLYGVSIDVGNSNVEDGVVTISGDTATFSLRGCDSDDPLTELAANKKAHRRGAPVVITDYPILAYLRNILNGESGYTIPNLLKYASGVVPVSPDDLTDKGYVDGLLAGVVTTVNVVVPGTAGETVAAGNPVYFDDADNEWKKTDADTAATVENTLVGIAQGAGVDGGAISGGVLLRGLDANQSGLTPGAIYYFSNTAGAFSSSAGTKEVTAGFALSATQLYFNPRFNQQITEDQQDALAGTVGTPSSTNPFVTLATITGAIVAWGGSAAPTGWLLCDGSAVSRTTYADLFAILSTTYGIGDGSTTFNLPNLKGKVPVGKDAAQTEFDTLGETGGAKTHTLTTAEMPAHTHTISGSGAAGGVTKPNLSNNVTATGSATTESTGGGGAHNNLQPYIVLNYIIKT